MITRPGIGMVMIKIVECLGQYECILFGVYWLCGLHWHRVSSFGYLGVEKLTSSVVLHPELAGLGIASGLLGSRKVMVNEYWVHGHLCLW